VKKGDLVFFDANPSNSDPTDHLGIYIGDNKIIHMANPELNITISDLGSA
jgi:cell wall-associated NlpC family hydrolase